MGLSDKLKEGTTNKHREVRNVRFNKDFIQGNMTRARYRVLIAGLYFVYKTLAEEFRKNKDNPYLKSVHFPNELERTFDASEEDLQFYYGEDWEKHIKYSPATKKYVERLKKISEENPLVLVAHHYTRFFGDLSGGFRLKQMAIKAMNLPSTGEGVHLYCFDNISDPEQFKNHYRSQLDSMPVTEEMSDKIVEEANLAFVHNIEILEEVDTEDPVAADETAGKP